MAIPRRLLEDHPGAGPQPSAARRLGRAGPYDRVRVRIDATTTAKQHLEISHARGASSIEAAVTRTGSGQHSSRSRRDDLETTVVILERARTGNDAAVERLVRRFLPELTRWAHGRVPRNCRPLDDTQTVVLDTLRSALSHLETFEYRREGAFLTYLRTIFMNKIKDKYRSAARRPDHGELSTALPAPDDPSADLEREEFWELYDEALGTLPERMREAVFLRLELAWGYQRIATAIGSPTPNAARMYVTRGIRRLATEMNGANL